MEVKDEHRKMKRELKKQTEMILKDELKGMKRVLRCAPQPSSPPSTLHPPSILPSILPQNPPSSWLVASMHDPRPKPRRHTCLESLLARAAVHS